MLAHEITHVTQRHLARFIEDAKSRQTKTLGAIVGSVVLALINPTLGMAALNATLALNLQNTINYTRSDELEADHIGIDLLYRAGFDPNQMAEFFSKLTSGSYRRIPRYPQVKVQENINFYFAKARIFVRFSKNSGDFCVEHFSELLKKNELQHRYNKNYLLYGLTLAYIQNRDYANAKKAFDRIEQTYRTNLFILDTFSDLELLRGNASEVIRVLTDRLKYTPKSPTVNLNLAIAYMNAKQHRKAVTLLKELSKSHPKNLLIQDLLTDCYKALGMKKEYYIASGSKYALVSDYNRSNMYYNYAYQFATTKLDKAKINAMIVQNEQSRKSDAQFEN